MTLYKNLHTQLRSRAKKTLAPAPAKKLPLHRLRLRNTEFVYVMLEIRIRTEPDFSPRIYTGNEKKIQSSYR
jgi:hypothetical protein